MSITPHNIYYFSDSFFQTLYCQVMAPVDSATVIAVGDLLFLDGDDAKPAVSQPDQGTLALNQELFHSRFLGIALDRSLAGQTEPIRAAARGRFEFDCASATFE